MLKPCIVPGREMAASTLPDKAMESAELHFAIAHDIRVRRTTRAIFTDEVVDDSLFVFDRRIESKESQPEMSCGAHGVAPITAPRAREPWRIPSLYENSGHLR